MVIKENAVSSIIDKIYKRDGNLVPFEIERIVNAVHRAMMAEGEGSLEEARKVAHLVLLKLEEVAYRHKFTPDVEGIQNDVEDELILSGYVKTAKAYIKYRAEHERLRKQQFTIPEKFRKLNIESSKYFNNKLNEFVYIRTYARWIEEEGRRETWIETIDRYINFMRENLGNKLTESEYREIREAILKQEVMPSMRLLQFAGRAARNTHVCAYNCSFIAPKEIIDFGEIMYVLMCGSGVGFSVESQNVHALPQIQTQIGEKLATHVIEDSKEGWCQALELAMNTWYSGKDIEFDYSKLRPLGARLKTMGGKSSGPDPLKALMVFVKQKILSRQGRRLTNLDVHDIICKIGEIVVSGGVRRSALISLSDLDDLEMRDAKSGQFYFTDPQRSLANNSAVYEEKPDNKTLMTEWLALINSGSGERGIFNRAGLASTLPKRRVSLLEQAGLITDGKVTGILGANPCGEIILQSKQFCNLSEVVARAGDNEETLLRKVRLATILGTYQATLTNFPYLSKEWRENCEKECLLGVSITGQWDCEVCRDPNVLASMKDYAVEVNKNYAKRFGINQSSCVTCVKPSGTVSQTVDCASGMHPRFARYYIRRIRISSTDSLFKTLRDQGVPYHPEVGQTYEEATTFVLEFPVKSPDSAVLKDDLTALDQLEHWKKVKENFTEHNPSITIFVGENEWIEVLKWIDKNWKIVGGLAFLPRSDHVYQLAPYEEITEKEYKELLEKTKNIDFSQLFVYEKYDETEIKKELACTGDACEII